MNRDLYKKKLQGAIIGRFAGCALGAPVELMEIGQLMNFARAIEGQTFPPQDYFLKAPNPDGVRYKVGKGRDFTKPDMTFLSTDDDIGYTLLCLMMLEDKKDKLSTDDVASYWLKYLPKECTYTAERTTLANLEQGIDPISAAIPNNTELDYIGAAIRIDGYGFTHPGNPKEAARLAYIDSYISHRNEGIDSAMYFAALIALAFESRNIDQSMIEALEYIPKEGALYKEITWALSIKDEVKDYLTANRLVTQRYPNMSWVHATNNACLTIWGIHIGQHDFTKAISETVAMGYDNDCTAATVGSVLGAYLGIESISPHWYEPWNNRILSYLNDIPEFKLDDVIDRYYQLGIELNPDKI